MNNYNKAYILEETEITLSEGQGKIGHEEPNKIITISNVNEGFKIARIELFDTNHNQIIYSNKVTTEYSADNKKLTINIWIYRKDSTPLQEETILCRIWGVYNT